MGRTKLTLLLWCVLASVLCAPAPAADPAESLAEEMKALDKVAWYGVYFQGARKCGYAKIVVDSDTLDERPVYKFQMLMDVRIRMGAATLRRVVEGSAKKGDVLGVARIAAIQAAKKTSELIPLCHPLAITRVAVDFSIDEVATAIECRATVETRGPTGVEMEALTAVQIGLLTIYDMCKAVDRGMVIESVRLLQKRGGNSGDWVAA